MNEERLYEFYKDFSFHYAMASDFEKQQIVDFMDETLTKLITFFEQRDDEIDTFLREIEDIAGKEKFDIARDYVNQQLETDPEQIQNEKDVQQDFQELYDTNIRNKKAYIFRTLYNCNHEYSLSNENFFSFLIDALNCKIDSDMFNEQLVNCVEYAETLIRYERTRYFKELKKLKDEYYADVKSQEFIIEA
ncbi:MAG: hypothetical protein KBT30_01455 [Clostridiales bacterium]|nr:hypothetical protein [Candidatus Apopatousia equi]